MTDREPFWAGCKSCRPHWGAIYLPMELSKAAKLMKKAACHKCGCDAPVPARQRDGQLLEVQA